MAKSDAEILRCLAKNLSYYPPDYKPSAMCVGCDSSTICSKILKVLEGKDGKE